MIFLILLSLVMFADAREERGGREGGDWQGRSQEGNRQGRYQEDGMGRNPSMSRSYEQPRSYESTGSHDYAGARYEQNRRDQPQYPVPTGAAASSYQPAPPSSSASSQMSAQQGAAQGIRQGLAEQHPDLKNWGEAGGPFYAAKAADAWKTSSWNDAASLLGMEASAPQYYSGDYAYPAQSSPNGSSQQGSPPQQGPSQGPPPASPPEWLPLGIFTLTAPDAAAQQPNMFLQLSINKQGQITGSFYNSTTKATSPIVGYTNTKTQLADWKISNIENSPIAEAGIYNLTQNETLIKVYFPNGQVQNWLMVRLQKPQ